MTNAELLVLLREAQRYVASHDCNSRCNCIAAYDLQRLFERIKAAIAERQDSATDVAEWKSDVLVGSIARVGDNHLRVWRWRDQYRWSVESLRKRTGSRKTEAEAKEAAIAAARGMK